MELINQRFSPENHGDYARWNDALQKLPLLDSACTLRTDGGLKIELPQSTQFDQLEETLQLLHPWRKGPYQVGNIFINTEWRSDWKWDRLKKLSIHGRVLDIGSGNGYFGWHMLAAGADEVIGIDPSLLFCLQHQAINRFVRSDRSWVLPFRIEEIPSTAQFDMVFSMGVVYHRREPGEHVSKLFELCAPKGTVVLESLVSPNTENLIPEARYGRMRNVWCIPSVQQMQSWMQDAGLKDIEVLDITPTTIEEQRSTDWMRYESLAQALDPNDHSRTIEGYPAPIRAVVVGYRP